MLYPLLRRLYFALPFKRNIFGIIKLIYQPSKRIAGYLKFKGIFPLSLQNGRSIRIFNDHSTLPSLLFWKGIAGHEKASLEIWQSLIPDAEVIFDLGANFGLFGLIAKGINPKANVIFVEPLPRNASRIKKNLTINGFDAEVVVKAMGNHEGEIAFFDMAAQENTIASIDRSFVESHQHAAEIRPIRVPMTSLDHYMITNKVKQLDLIKIDVEGADFEVLLGTRKTLQRFQPTILIEITNNENAAQINSLLEKLNLEYFFYEINDKEGLIPCDSLQRVS